MMIRNRHLLSALALIGAVAFISTAFAKHQHQDGQQLLGNKIATTGKHDVHKVGEHTVSIHVENKKIARVTAAHRTKGNVAVKKYKTTKKMAQGYELNIPMENAGALVQSARYQIAQSQIVYIGYAFSDGIDEYIYWFPAEMVVDPFTGAVEYIPVT
jgi:hypothetical protein